MTTTMMMQRAVHSLARRAPTRISSAATTRTLLRASLSTTTLEAKQRALQYDIIPATDFGAYKEYSVIHTDRSLNLMSDPFQRVMRDLNELLKVTYNADKVAIIPG